MPWCRSSPSWRSAISRAGSATWTTVLVTSIRLFLIPLMTDGDLHVEIRDFGNRYPGVCGNGGCCRPASSAAGLTTGAGGQDANRQIPGRQVSGRQSPGSARNQGLTRGLLGLCVFGPWRPETHLQILNGETPGDGDSVAGSPYGWLTEEPLAARQPVQSRASIADWRHPQ